MTDKAKKARFLRRSGHQYPGLWAACAILAVSILMGTAVGDPVLSGGMEASSEPFRPPQALAGTPTSPFDQRIYGIDEAPGIYYALAPNYLVEFHLPANPPLVTVYGADSALSVDPRPSSETQVRVEILGPRITYRDFFGEGASLAYLVALTGLKEEIVFESPAALRGTSGLQFSLRLDGSTPDAQLDGFPVSFLPEVGGALEVLDHFGMSQFSIPKGIVVPADQATRGLLPLSYEVRQYGDRVLVRPVLDATLFDLPSSAFPLVVDPSIDPVDTVVTYNDQTIVQEGDLTILSTGWLTLNNVELIFNSSADITIESGGMFDLLYSDILTSSAGIYYNGTVNGTFNVLQSSLDHVGTRGIVVNAGATLAVDQSVFTNSRTVFEFQGAPAGGHIQNCVFDHVGTGLFLNGSINLIGYAISDNSFSYGDYGLILRGSTLNAPPMQDNTFEELDVAGVWAEGGAIIGMSQNSFYTNYRGVHLDASTADLNSDVFDGNNFGLVAINGSVATLTSVSMSNVNFDLYINGSNVTITGSPYMDWTISETNVNLRIQHLVDVRVLKKSGIPDFGITVRLVDAAGNLESTNTTDTQGWASNLVATEYEKHNNGVYSFYTPHLIEVGTEGRVHAVIGKDRTFTLYNLSDADYDGIADVDEDLWEDVSWMEAEGRGIDGSSQEVPDYNASDGFALQRQSGAGNNFLDQYRNPPSRPGSYQFFAVARSIGGPQSFRMIVMDQSGTTLADTNVTLDEEYRFYWTDSFDVSGYQKLRSQLQDPYAVPHGAILVDRFGFIRYKDDQGNRTAALPGRVTDPVQRDTDLDRGVDGLEVFPHVFWFEVENLNASTARQSDVLASGSWGAVHQANNPVIADEWLGGLGLSSNTTIELWLRVRCLVDTDCTFQTTLEENGTSNQFQSTVNTTWRWVNTSQLTLSSDNPTFRLLVEDSADPFLGDGSNYILVDRMTIAVVEEYPSPTFYLSDPLDRDIDRDGLSDGREVSEFFTKDLLQAEDSASSFGFVSDAGRMVTSKADGTPYGERYFTVNLTVDREGEWMIGLFGKFSLYVDLPTLTPPNLTRAFNFTLALASDPQSPIPPYQRIGMQTKTGDDPTVGGLLLTNFSVVSRPTYLIDAGSYILNVTLNETYIWFLDHVQPYASGVWSLSADFFLLQRFILNPLDPDAEDDGVDDGVESEHGSYPLNPDSDYDNVSDWEEIFAGVDGRSSSPLRVDTDADGRSDWAEIFGETPTDVGRVDTDYDHLPDGWIDGYRFDLVNRTYTVDDAYLDGIRQPWEGEDLDSDGSVGGGGFSYDWATGESLGGETDPSSPDSDNDTIDDGWEVRYKGHKHIQGSPSMLDPLSASNATDDIDSDNLTNVQEYNFETDPYDADTDDDGILDGDELRIMVRTNVPEGTVLSKNYTQVDGSSWVYADPNPYDGTTGSVYWYQSTMVNSTLETRWVMGSFETGQGPTAIDDTSMFPIAGISGGAAYSLSQEGDTYPYGNRYYRLSGDDTWTGNSYAYYQVFDVDVLVHSDTYLQWKSIVLESPDLSGRISLELKFTDGTYARDLGIIDAHGNFLHPALHVNLLGVWESYSYNISTVAGKTIDWIGVAYDDAGASGTLMGPFLAYFDDIRIVDINGATQSALPNHAGVTLLARFEDGALVVLGSPQAPTAKLYVWSNNTDVLDGDDDGILQGTLWVFVEGATGGAETSNLSVAGFKLRELHGGVNPLSNDSDRDLIIDGLEGPSSGGAHWWWVDTDSDGRVSAADNDSDADGVPDGIEDWDRDGIFEPYGNETDPLSADTDSDGIDDGADAFPLDYDNDRLRGWTGFEMEEGLAGTQIDNPDSDGDGIPDGDEDANQNGYTDPGETDPADADTDDDGVWDGFSSFWGAAQTIRREGESYSASSGNVTTISDGSASNGQKARLLPNGSVEYQVQASYVGLYQLILSLGDVFDETEGGSHAPKSLFIEFDANVSASFAGRNWSVMIGLASVPEGNMTNFSYRWNVRFPSAAQYTLRLSVSSYDDDANGLFLDSWNLSLILYPGERSFGTNASGNDTDQDNVQDGTELGITWVEALDDSEAQTAGLLNATGPSFVADADNKTTTDPLRADTDGDGLVDGWILVNASSGGMRARGEDYNSNGKVDWAQGSAYNDSNPLRVDSDEDGLTDGREYEFAGFTDPGNWDTDGDGLSDGLEVGLNACPGSLANCTPDMDPTNVTNPNSADTDGDGTSDGAEDINQNGRYLDPVTGYPEGYPGAPETNPNCWQDCDDDGDGLTNTYEQQVSNTDPWNPDTDSDGLIDGREVDLGTDPLDHDTDNDDLLDGIEVLYGTLPYAIDSDNDGVKDGKEVDWNVDSDGDGAINALDTDSDNDGVPDGSEEYVKDGVFDPSTDWSNMTNPDTDGDGLTDLEEYQLFPYQSAYLKDADNDGLTGYSYMGVWYGGQEAAYGTDFNISDTDDDGLSDWQEVMGAWCYYDEENCWGDPDVNRVLNATNPDSDGDGLKDGREVFGWEFFYSTGARAHFTSNPFTQDTDGDGLNDFAEFGGDDIAGTNPRSPDTDFDGLCDKGNATCFQDDDNTTFNRAPPAIDIVSLSIASAQAEDIPIASTVIDWLGLNTYYVRVSFSVYDPSRIFAIVVSLQDLAPEGYRDPVEDWLRLSNVSLEWQYRVPTTSHASASLSNHLITPTSEPEPDQPSIDMRKFRYGYGVPWTIVINPDGFGGDYNVTFTIHDRGILLDGFRVLIEAMDAQGNLNEVEMESTLDKHFAEHVIDAVKDWFEQVLLPALRAFLVAFVEAAGPIAGLVLGFVAGVAKSFVDMIFGIFDFLYQLSQHGMAMINALGEALGNIAELLKGLIGHMINDAEWTLPASWEEANPEEVTVDSMLEYATGFFQDPLSAIAAMGGNKRLEYDTQYVVGRIAGFVFVNFLGGGSAILGKITSLHGIQFLMGSAKAAVAPVTHVLAGAAGKAGSAAGGLGMGAAAALAVVFAKFGGKLTKEVDDLMHIMKKFPRFEKRLAAVAADRVDDVAKGLNAAAKARVAGRLHPERLDQILDDTVRHSATNKAGALGSMRGGLGEIHAVKDSITRYGNDFIELPRPPPKGPFQPSRWEGPGDVDQLIRQGGPNGAITHAVTVKTHAFDNIVDSATGNIKPQALDDVVKKAANDAFENLEKNAGIIGGADRVADVVVMGGELSGTAQAQIKSVYLSLGFKEVVFIWA